MDDRKDVAPAPTPAAAAYPPGQAPEPRNPTPKPQKPGAWELTETGVRVGDKEFMLKAGPEVLVRFGEETAIASRTYVLLTSAEDAISGARGEIDQLLDRARATVRARDLAEDEIQRLTNVFCRFFEPAGLDVALGGEGRLGELAGDVVEHFTRKRR